ISVTFSNSLKKDREVNPLEVQIDIRTIGVTRKMATLDNLIFIINLTIVILVLVFDIAWSDITKLDCVSFNLGLIHKNPFRFISIKRIHRKSFIINLKPGSLYTSHIKHFVFHIRHVDRNIISEFANLITVA